MDRRHQPLSFAGFLACIAMVLVSTGCSGENATADRASRGVGEITFNRDIAPIVFRHCAPCHQEGQPGPFPLVSYADFKKRAAQIVKVTQSRFMPPWLPDEGYGEFAHTRRLSSGEMELIRQWAEAGAIEGEGETFHAATAPGGWLLGTPDLVVELPEAYTLPGEGPDVYRNFVIPVPLRERRFVRAIEFKPRTKVIHHAFMMLDPTRQSRRQDAADAEPGFSGVAVLANMETPGGYFLSWQPGRRPIESMPGMAWEFKPGLDLVLQMHMQPRGASEKVQPAVGLYFTDTRPTNSPVKFCLTSYDIDIPAGQTDYVVEDRFVAPADGLLISIMPHAHFLARRIEAQATFPSGKKEPLLRISDWDFNWQSDYQFARPMFVPKGTELAMRFTYDNSTNNIRNPSQPPTRVKFGPQTRDEMAEFWMQAVANTPADRDAWALAIQRKVVADSIKYNSGLIEREPTNAHAHVQLSKAMLAVGDKARARALVEKAIALDAGDEEAHYNLGVMLMDEDKNRSAAGEFLKALEINPENYRALNNLGLIYIYARQYDNSERALREALRINPDDKAARANLELLAQERRNAQRR